MGLYASLCIADNVIAETQTLILYHTPISGQHHRVYALNTMLGPPKIQELDFFLLIQDILSQLLTLLHKDPKKVL